MKLIWNWREVLKKAHSLRFIFLAGILSGLEMIFPEVLKGLTRWQFALVMFSVVGAAAIARLIAQRGLDE